MKRASGFTLIEILVALALFGILASITSGAMYYAFNARARVSEQADKINTLQLALSIIEQDFSQIIARTSYGNDFHVFPAFIGSADYIELTRGGIPNPQNSAHRSTLKRVAYLCANNRLVRRSWSAVDMPNREHYHDQRLLSNLKHCHFAFLDTHLQLHQEWDNAFAKLPRNAPPLPKAIQVNFTLTDWGKASFLFIVSPAAYYHV
jgi:general secretion pathway protein J